jgi:hypothetical protein
MRALTLNLGGECCGIPHCIVERAEMLVLVNTNTKRLHPLPAHGCVSIRVRLGSGGFDSHSHHTLRCSMRYHTLGLRLGRPSRAAKQMCS